ncbi:ATP-dependent DNA helicase Pif1-like [Oratosquilla oratoria]|uniref:ATP-dependent DNA helicase Pif1-like n=1 Tax=Oratosquilla oratoria TaxID=337810 RepID=UPI003F75C9DC
MDCVNNRRSGGFFLNAPGGTGKSFVLNLLLDTVRANSEIALGVASSGIAATVLHGGRTAQNMFRIPIMEHNEVKPCSIKLNSELARLIRMTSLIVWDEVVMANKNTITALDYTAKDITGNKDCFMGGIPFVCACDFRQMLPVIRGGGKNEELKYNIKKAFFWEDLHFYSHRFDNTQYDKRDTNDTFSNTDNGNLRIFTINTPVTITINTTINISKTLLITTLFMS